MRISPFFQELRSAYQAEMDDLTFDSEGRDVLTQRLAEKRKELDFLLQMSELNPEMVAVVFHQGFRFKLPAVMDHLLTQEADEFPDWESLSDAVQLTPSAQALAPAFLKQPWGGWFLTVAAGLEYMHGKLDVEAASRHAAQDEGDEDDEDQRDELDADELEEARAREEAGADWMVEQGFDRKD
ncbi:MAG: hypothetical protein EOP38_09600 [Rubrivivax sp.]|nr:MAG: hypothetical protein EOP38_09600 [Rubrivivax sp.]